MYEIYDISYKKFVGTKPMRIRFDNVDGFIKTYDGTRYLVLFDPERYDGIYKRIKHIVSEKSSIKYSIDNNFFWIKIDSYNSLPTEKALTFHNVIILTKSVIIKSKNSYCCNGYHDLLVIPMDLRDIAIFNIKSADYCCVISGVSESETIKLMQNIDLTGKRKTSLNSKFFIRYKE